MEMAASIEEILFEKFEDLIDKDDEDVIEITNDDIDESAVHKLDANALTLNDLLHEMERRGLHARGFFEDDAKVLQAEFDKEHRSYVESKKKEMMEARALEAKQAVLQRRRMAMELEIKEEKNEIENDRVVANWHEAVRNSTAQAYCRFYVNAITARSLAKALWDNNNIVSLDLSHMNLSDLSGAYICRSLRNNRSISKLELGGNCLGLKTCKSLGDSLETNHVVKYVSIESNSLTIDKDPSGINALSRMLTVNKSLVHMSIWRCNIDQGGCQSIHEAIMKNDTVICFDMGYNEWTQKQIRQISDKLQENRRVRETKIRAENQIIQKQNEREKIQKDINEKRAKDEANLKWIEDQKLERAEARRDQMEKEELRRVEEERRRREEEERERELREAEAAKKKKKGKKGKKGKKKGK